MILNGCLAGLVAITAPCAFVSVPSSLAIGAVAGVLVVLAVLAFDRLRIDDPVGALSVHLANGVFGTLAVGLFAEKRIAAAIGTDAPGLADGLLFSGGLHQLGAQALGAAAVAGFVFSVSLALWALVGPSWGCACPLRRSWDWTSASTGWRPTPASRPSPTPEGGPHHEAGHRLHPAAQAA
jgi:Amt family ammonium transporter